MAGFAWPFLLSMLELAARKLVIGTFRRTIARLHEEKATSVVESLAYIAPGMRGACEEDILI